MKWQILEYANYDGYTFDVKLGRGAFATVWKAHANDNNSVAIKIYKHSEEYFKYFLNEVKTLSIISSHPNIIKLLHTYLHIENVQLSTRLANTQLANTQLASTQLASTQLASTRTTSFIYPCIVLELQGDHLGRIINHYIDKFNEGFPLKVVRCLLKQVINGLKHIHSYDIIHTDIKPSNMLVPFTTKDILNMPKDNIDQLLIESRLVLADFGGAVNRYDKKRDTVGTATYLPPEIILGLDYDEKADVWSTLVSAYEMWTGDSLFDIDGTTELGSNKANMQAQSDTYADHADIHTIQVDTANTYLVHTNEDVNIVEERKIDTQAKSDANVINANTYTSHISSSLENEYTLVLMQKILGPIPCEMANDCYKYFFNGKLKKYEANELQTPLTIMGLVLLNYEVDPMRVRPFIDFLEWGLRYIPADRPSTQEILNHTFVKDIFPST